MASTRNTSRHHFRLPSLHRLNTKDIASPPPSSSCFGGISDSSSYEKKVDSGPYYPLATPPLSIPQTPPHITHRPSTNDRHHIQQQQQQQPQQAGPLSSTSLSGASDFCCSPAGSNPTLSPSSTTSPSSFGGGRGGGSPFSYATPLSYASPASATASVEFVALPLHGQSQTQTTQQQHISHPTNVGVSGHGHKASTLVMCPSQPAATQPPWQPRPAATATTVTNGKWHTLPRSFSPRSFSPSPPLVPSTSGLTSPSTNTQRIARLLQLRRKHSRIDIELEMEEERERWGSPASPSLTSPSAQNLAGGAVDGGGSGGEKGRSGGCMLDLMEPRPRPGLGVTGSGGIGGIFEVLEG